MPMFRSEDQYPDWCELEHFEVVRLDAGDEHCFARRGEVEKLIVGGGRCRLRVGAEEVEAATGANLDLTGPGSFEVLEVEEAATLVRFCGRWGAETGGSGIFNMDNSPSPRIRAIRSRTRNGPISIATFTTATSIGSSWKVRLAPFPRARRTK